MANRDQAIIDFQEKPGVNILIVSLKAAALGLNLVAANHVVLLDLVILRDQFCVIVQPCLDTQTRDVHSHAEPNVVWQCNYTARLCLVYCESLT